MNADRIVEFFEGFREQDLVRLGDFYAPDARFKDPFNEVSGLPAIERVYRHMFAQLETPRFVVRQQVEQDGQVWLAWDFHFGAGRKAQVIHGASCLVLVGGRIASHRDYWDAAEEVYEKVPVLGALMRWLKRRIAA